MTTQALAPVDLPTTAPTRSTARGGLTFVDHLTLFLIGLVVVLVSLPRLRRFALRENELDAIAMLSSLGADLPELSESLPEGGLAALLAASPKHENRFEDLEVLAGGRLRRHGYLFDAVEASPGQWSLRGWPWEHGHTGLGAFVFDPSRGLLGTANTRGVFDGPERPPDARAAAVESGWHALAHGPATP